MWGRGLFEGSFEKDPSSSPKTPQKWDCYPRKEERTTCFLFSCGEGEFSLAVRAVQILVCAPLAYRLLRSLALRGVGERWRGSKSAQHAAAMRRARARSPHKTAAYCTSLGESPTARWRRWRARSPPRRPQTAKQPRRFSFANFSLCACGVKEKSGYGG